MLKTKEEIKSWLIDNNINEYEISDNLVVDIYQDVYINFDPKKEEVYKNPDPKNLKVYDYKSLFKENGENITDIMVENKDFFNLYHYDLFPFMINEISGSLTIDSKGVFPKKDIFFEGNKLGEAEEIPEEYKKNTFNIKANIKILNGDLVIEKVHNLQGLKDFKIDTVNCSVHISDAKKVISLPSIRIVHENYIITRCILEKLNGKTERVMGDFDCSCNYLHSLEGGPLIVDGIYDCTDNLLIDLKGVAKEIGHLKCSSQNNIGAVSGNNEPDDNILHSLEGLHPNSIKYSISCLKREEINYFIKKSMKSFITNVIYKILPRRKDSKKFSRTYGISKITDLTNEKAVLVSDKFINDTALQKAIAHDGDLKKYLFNLKKEYLVKAIKELT